VSYAFTNFSFKLTVVTSDGIGLSTEIWRITQPCWNSKLVRFGNLKELHS
jgi:hypothetical protein